MIFLRIPVSAARAARGQGMGHRGRAMRIIQSAVRCFAVAAALLLAGGGDQATAQIASAYGRLSADSRTLTWEPEDLPSGIYTCRMVAGDFTQSKRIVFIGGE